MFPSHLRPVPQSDELSSRVIADSREYESLPWKEHGQRRRLGPLQCIGAFLIFALWLVLLGAGIMVDTTRYRIAISADGAQRLRAEGQSTDGAVGVSPPAIADAGDSIQNEQSRAATSAETLTGAPALGHAWLVVLFCFLPLNLAWLCVCASTLGGVGNLAHLGADDTSIAGCDTSNPVLSAVLRGFFVYLFLMSGLLLLDGTPFSNAGPSQYLRLAGFLSLFSFVVSYHPNLFGTLIMSAFERIQVRAQHENGASPPTVQHTAVRTVAIETTTAMPAPVPDK